MYTYIYLDYNSWHIFDKDNKPEKYLQFNV